LDWVLDGARHQGLELDGSNHSRIFELEPDFREYLANSPPSPNPRLIDRLMALMPRADREPGPAALYEVAISARQRWKEAPDKLKDKAIYRPPTLALVAPLLDELEPDKLGVGMVNEDVGSFTLYQVKRNDTLSAIAQTFYGNAEKWPAIFAANLEKLEDPDRIYIGQSLRIPRSPA
jgi:nucleoid-associated protein YgaU